MTRDSRDYLDQWAMELVAAIGKRQALRIIDDYEMLSKNPKLARYDREVATVRAKVLAEHM